MFITSCNGGFSLPSQASAALSAGADQCSSLPPPTTQVDASISPTSLPWFGLQLCCHKSEHLSVEYDRETHDEASLCSSQLSADGTAS